MQYGTLRTILAGALCAGLGMALWVRRLARRPSLLKSTLRHLATDRELLEKGSERHDTR